MSALGALSATSRFVFGMTLHVASCAALMSFACGIPGLVSGWLAIERPRTDLRQGWRDWRVLWRKQPARPEAGAVLVQPALFAALAAASCAVVLAPGFARLWPDAAGADLLVVMVLLVASRLLAWLPALGPGIAADALDAGDGLAVGLRDLVLAGMLGFALTQMAGGSQPDVLPGLLRSGTAAPATLPLALACAIVAMVLLAASEFAAPTPFGRQLSGPDLALAQAGRAVRSLGWLMAIAWLLPPAPPSSASWAAVSGWPLAMVIWLAKLAIGTLALALVCTVEPLRMPGEARRQGACLLFATLSALLVFVSGRLA